MSYQNGIINHLIRNSLEIIFTDNDPDNDPDHVEATITEENIVSESMKLKQSICDGDELRFGGCIASQFSIDLLKTADRLFENELANRWITVKITQTYADPDEIIYPSSTLYPSDDLYPGRVIGTHSEWIFSGYIDSAKVSKTDKNVINVVAYDIFTKLNETDATDDLFFLYKTYGDSCSLYRLYGLINLRINSRFGISLDLEFFGETYYVDHNSKMISDFIVNNSYWKDTDKRVTYGSLIKQIYELCGLFGVITPNSGKGTIKAINLFNLPERYDFYEKLETEDYKATGYTDFLFSVSGSNRTGKSVTALGGLSNANDNAVEKTYDFSNNILILQPFAYSGQSRTSTAFDYLINRTTISIRLAVIFKKRHNNGQDSMAQNDPQCYYNSFQPLTATVDGRPWVKVGSPIEIMVNKTDVNGDYIIDPETGEIEKEAVQTYMLSRTLSGIQALTDVIEVKGAR